MAVFEASHLEHTMQRPARLLVLSLAVLGAAGVASGCAAQAAPASVDAPAHALPGPVTTVVRSAAMPATGSQPRAAIMRGGTAATNANLASATATGAVDHVNLTIVTGDMIGKTEYPAFIPSDIVLPAHSTVVVTITNFDDATPLAKGMESYAAARGVVGNSFSVTPIDAKSPNGAAGPTKTLSSLDPADVSHTLTAPGLGLNVPIAPHARVTFTIQTGDAGTYTWHCFDPCGAGATGWGTAMSAMRGYMEGTITVA